MDRSIASTTLYEDWRSRRDRLSASTETGRLRAAPQLKILDYLLSRYQGSDEGKRPARFHNQGRLHWNDRRIVVHHHLGRGEVAGVKNRAEADQRITSILHRMTSDDREEDHALFADEPTKPKVPAGVPLAWYTIARLLKWNRCADHAIRAALAQYPFLPRVAMQHLYARVGDISCNDGDAMLLLWHCHNTSAVDYAVRAWRERVAHNQSDAITEELEEYFRGSEKREMAAAKMREELANDNSSVRLAATALLEELGELDDIGLFSDLLSLPESDDEDERERDALIHAMKTLAEGGK